MRMDAWLWAGAALLASGCYEAHGVGADAATPSLDVGGRLDVGIAPPDVPSRDASRPDARRARRDAGGPSDRDGGVCSGPTPILSAGGPSCSWMVRDCARACLEEGRGLDCLEGCTAIEDDCVQCLRDHAYYRASQRCPDEWRSFGCCTWSTHEECIGTDWRHLEGCAPECNGLHDELSACGEATDTEDVHWESLEVCRVPID